METGSVGPAKPAEKYEGGGPGSSPKRRPGPGDARKDEKGWTFRGVITLEIKFEDFKSSPWWPLIL